MLYEVFRTSHCVEGQSRVRGPNTACRCHICDITSFQYSLQLRNADAEKFNTAVSLTPVSTLRLPCMLLHLNATLLLVWGWLWTTLHVLHSSMLLLLPLFSSLLCAKTKRPSSASESHSILLFFHFDSHKWLPHRPHAHTLPISLFCWCIQVQRFISSSS